jgi:hypothetical protein
LATGHAIEKCFSPVTIDWDILNLNLGCHQNADYGAKELEARVGIGHKSPRLQAQNDRSTEGTKRKQSLPQDYQS